MGYVLKYSTTAKKDLAKHVKSGNKALISKISKILKELKNTPYKGIGKPERLKYDLSGYWSRRLNQEHRIVYKVEENIVTVIIVSAMGHYE